MFAAAQTLIAPIQISARFVRIACVGAAIGFVALTMATWVHVGASHGATGRSDFLAARGAPAATTPHEAEPRVLPLAARGPVSATLGSHDRGYWIHGVHADNSAQQLAIRFSASGVTIAAGSARAELRLTSYGYADTQQTLTAATPHAVANRLTYERGGVDEWYANGPFGLEQGFDVRARPTAGAGPLELAVGLRSNLSARLDGADIVLSGHRTRLRYGRLTAHDAAGRPLRAWFALRHHQITIAVADRGAVYPVHIDPFVQQAELTASDGAVDDVLGAALAMDGDTIVAAAPNKTVGTNPGQGALYVFVKPSSGWADTHQTAKLTSSDGTALGGVAVAGDTIVAGAPGKQLGANQDQGAAYVFVRPADGWRDGTQTAVLTAADGGAEDRLGSGVAMSGDTIVAGAPGRNSGRGAGYVFVKPRSGWKDGTQTAVLSALGGAAQDSVGLINSVAIFADTIALGGSNHTVGDHTNQGLAYVYVKPDAGWTNATQNVTLSSTDGGAGDLFGFAVAVSADTVVVGAPHHMIGRRGSGAAYVFTEPPFGWLQRATDTETAELTPSDGATDDRFGAQLGISGSTVFAGSFLHQVGPNPAQGAAYVFIRPGFVWSDETENGQLTAADGSARNGFSDTVAASGNLVVAGAPARTIGQNLGQGAVYLFGVPPTITIATPARGATFTQGQPVLASYVCAAPSAATLTSCAGPVAAGARIDTATPGPHVFTVRTVDSDGATSTQTTSYTVTAMRKPGPPTVAGLRQAAATWRTGGAGGRHRPPLGTTFSFTVNQPATVTLSFTRQMTGRVVGGQCRVATKGTNRRPRCTRAIAQGTLTLAAHSGVNRIRFRGRVSSHRMLQPGHYTMTLAATNADRQRTTQRPLRFTIVT